MRPIRILAAEMPRILLDIVDSIIAAETDMVIVGTCVAESDLLSTVRRVNADVLIVGDDGAPAMERWTSLLYERPRLKVLMLEQADGTALFYELRPHRTPLGDVSPAELVNAIRAAMGSEVA